MPQPYPFMMRTTISIDDRLLEEAKHRASQSRQTLGQFVEDAVLRRHAEHDGRPPARETRSSLAGRDSAQASTPTPTPRCSTYWTSPDVLVLDVYALVAVFRADHPHHAMVRPWWDRTLAEPSRTVVVPDIVWVGFVRVVTSRRIFTVAATVEEAFAFAEAVRAHPAYRTFSPSAHVFAEFARMCRQDQVSGNLVTDAWIAATALVLAAPVVTLDATSGASTDWASSRRRHDGRMARRG